MNKDLEYYLNNLKTSCIFPANKNECLLKKNYLKEFSTEEEKELVLKLLGINEKLENIKIINIGQAAIDSEPKEGNKNSVVSSDGLYKEFLKYVKQTDLQEWQQAVWKYYAENVANFIREDLIPYKIKWNRLENVYSEKFQELEDKYNQLIALYQGLLVNDGNYLISRNFGDGDNITISLKTLTHAIESLRNLISDYTGTPIGQVQVDISPNYIFTADSFNCNISVSTSSGVFDYLIIEAKAEGAENYELIYNSTDDHNGQADIDDPEDEIGDAVSHYSKEIELTGTTTIKVTASVLGIEYIKEKTITKYLPFFIGSGKNSWRDIMVPKNAVQSNSVSGEHIATIELNGDKLFVIVPKSLENDALNITMGGFEIPMDKEEQDDTYIVYTSKKEYKAGSYTIKIET